MKSSATRRSAARSTAARSTPRASRARRSSRALAPGPAAGRQFPQFPLRLRRRRRSRPRHRPRHLRRTVRRRHCAAARAGATGEDVAVAVTVPLAQVATGGDVRVDAADRQDARRRRARRLRGRRGDPAARPGRAAARATVPPGDAIVTLRYAPHPLFKVEGRDLRLDLPITLYEAVLGAKVRAPTLVGRGRNHRAGRRPAAAGCCGCAARVCRRRAIMRRAICS